MRRGIEGEKCQKGRKKGNEKRPTDLYSLIERSFFFKHRRNCAERIGGGIFLFWDKMEG